MHAHTHFLIRTAAPVTTVLAIEVAFRDVGNVFSHIELFNLELSGQVVMATAVHSHGATRLKKKENIGLLWPRRALEL